MKIAIAGATGFVGRALVDSLLDEHEVAALCRQVPASAPENPRLSWRKCDLFKSEEVRDAMQGADVAFYLVHSMMPTARLDQSSFADTDLYLAEEFSRAARAAGVKRFIYLGGIIPEAEKISTHLQSRKEVERALSDSGLPVTTLRAGIIIGPGGSSFQLVYLLVRRLPVMLCPRWTLNRTQPIARTDVIALLRFCLEDSRTAGETYDIGGPDITTYRELMLECARLLGCRRLLLSVRYFAPALSTLWVCLVTGASRKLVAPLVRSLAHEMITQDLRLLELYGRPLRPLRDVLGESLKGEHATLGEETRKRARSRRKEYLVRSIQRVPFRNGYNSAWLARRYFAWLGRALRLVLRVERRQKIWKIHLRGLAAPLLVFQPTSSGFENSLKTTFSVTEGLLKRRKAGPARFEFMLTLGSSEALIGLHEFPPWLHWRIYRATQAMLHLGVMWLFGRYLTLYFRNRPKFLRA